MGKRATSGAGKKPEKTVGRKKSRKGRAKGKKSSSAGSTKKARERAAGLIDPNLHVVVKDELRIQILSVAIQRLYSPSEFAREAGIPLNVAAAHFRVLVRHGYLELVKEEKVRGTVKHFYRASKSGFISDANWGTVADALRPGIAGAILQDFIGRASQAIDTGTMSSRDTACLYWAPRDLDEIAWAEQVKMVAWCIEESKRLEEDTVQRRANGESSDSFHSTFAIAAFPSPTHEEVKKHKARSKGKKRKAPKPRRKGKGKKA